MSKNSKNPVGDYVRSVTEETRQYLNDLKSENDTLREIVARLEADRGTQGESRDVAAELAEARRLLTDRENELRKAQDQIRQLQEQLLAYGQKELVFREQLATLESKHVQADGRHADLERRLSHLCSLYVASYRIHESLDREDVLAAVSEVIANSIGCEVFGVFEGTPDAASLSLISSMGVEEAEFDGIKPGDDPVSAALRSGEIYVASEPPEGAPAWERALVCIPLKLPDGSIVGAIVLFELLPQKPMLEPVDHELFDLLGSQAALALLWSRQGEDGDRA